MSPCRFCKSERPTRFGYCLDCDSFLGFPIVGWVLVLFFALGFYAMALGKIPR